MALTNLDILHIIDPFQKSGIFKGVFPCDELPKKFTLPAAFVINLSKHNSRGSHWIGLFINKDRKAEYFDSFGFQPNQSEIIRFIKLNSKEYSFNNKQIQHISSNKCGKFVILFILAKMYNKNFGEILEKFSSNLGVNEVVIENLFHYFTQLRTHIDRRRSTVELLRHCAVYVCKLNTQLCMCTTQLSTTHTVSAQFRSNTNMKCKMLSELTSYTHILKQ